MRTRRSTKTSPAEIEDTNIEELRLNEKAQEDYYEYMLHVVEDRAIYAKVDGLKPVTRRLLWAAYKLGLTSTAKFAKAAKVVGETMGNYHPHGDQAIFGALVTAVNQYQKLFDGSGNWGSMTDDPAAARYVECRLSKYSELVFFDKFYINTLYSVDNYDDSREEPLTLPCLLPNALINGNFGIAPGVRTQTPTFTVASMVDTLIKVLKAGGVAKPEHCLGLEFITEYGGVMRKSKTLKGELLQFFKTGKGKFIFDSTLNDDGVRLRIDRFAPIGKLDGTQTKKGYKPGLLDRLASIPGVDRVFDDTNTKDKFNAYVVEFKRSLSGEARKAVVNKVRILFSAAETYSVQVVDRRPHPDHKYGFKKLNMSNVPDMINAWLKERIHIEKVACTFWVKKRQAEIKHLELMRLAVKNRKFIIQALDKSLNDEALAAFIAKGLKITVEQANVILDLKVRQLKALEDKVLVAKIKDLKEEIAGYEDRIARPKSYIAKQIVSFGKALA